MSPAAGAWTLSVRGESMRFLLKAGDAVLVERARLEDLRPGDLAVLLEWKDSEPAYVVHRLLASVRWKGIRYALTKGDSNLWPDRPTAASSVVGRAAAAQFHGRWLAARRPSLGRAALLCLAGAPVYRALTALDRASREVLSLAWSRLPGPLRARGVQRLLLSAMTARDRAVSAAGIALQRRAAAWACGAVVPAPAAARAPRPEIGYLDEDRTWSGVVNVEGDVFVPPGVTLRVEAGADVRLAAKSRWDCTAEPRGWRLSEGGGSAGRCRLVVAGRLLVEGSPKAPARFGGSPWAGLHFVGASAGSRLAHAELAACEREAVVVTDSAQASLEDVALRDCGAGLAVRGAGAQAALARCRLERCRERGLAVVAGRLSAEDTSIDEADCGVFADGGELVVERCRISDGRLGVGVRAGEARLGDTRVARMSDAGLELDGRRQVLERFTVADCARGVRFAGESLEARALSLVGCDTGLAQRGGRVVWTGGAVEGGRLGLELAGGRLALADVALRGQSVTAARVEGSLELADARVAGCGAAIDVLGGEVRARRLEVERCPGGVGARSGVLQWVHGSLRSSGGVRLGEGARGRLEQVTLADGSGQAVDLHRARLEASDVLITGWPLVGVLAREAEGLSLRRCRVERCGVGVSARSGPLQLEEVGIEGCQDAGVDAEASQLDASELRVSGGTCGLVLRGGKARLRGLSLADCRVVGLSARDSEVEVTSLDVLRCDDGVVLDGGRARLEGVSVDGSERGALSTRRTAVELIRLSARRCGRGLSFEEGAARLGDVTLSGIAECALRSHGADLEAGRLNVRGAGSGASLHGEARLTDALFEDCRAVIDVDEGRLAWRIGGARGGARGLRLGPGAQATLEGLAIGGVEGPAVELESGSLTASGCVWTDVGSAAVRVAGPGRAFLERCRFERCAVALAAAAGTTRLRASSVSRASRVGLSFESGRHRYESVTFRGCVDRVFAAAGADVEEVVSPRLAELWAAAARRGILAAVLRTRRWPVLGRAYRLIYVLPVRIFQAACALDRRVAFLAAHRSWAAGVWQPGTSDVDLLIGARDLDGAGGPAWLSRHWRRWLRLKKPFPFLGECLTATPADWAAYARWGGLRARDLSRQLFVLSGRAPSEQPRPVSPKEALEPLGETAHAYTRLMAWALWPPSSPAVAASHAEKAARDLLRVSATPPGEPLALSRETAFDAAGSAARPYRLALSALARAAAEGRDDPRARAELCAAGLATLDGLASAAAPAWRIAAPGARPPEPPRVAAAPAAPIELARRRAWRERLAQALGPVLVAGCCDDVYRSWLVLEDEAPAGAWTAAFEALSGLPPEDRPSTLPLLVTRGVWAAWSRLAYLESPLRFLEPGTTGEDALYEAGQALPGVWQYAWNLPALAVAPAGEELSLDLSREALATLRCTWRFQTSPASGLSRGYALHYLLSRVLTLRLRLERGLSAPTFGLDLLVELHAREFPEGASALRALWHKLCAGSESPDLSAASAWCTAQLSALGQLG